MNQQIIDQTFLNEDIPLINVRTIHETKLTAEILQDFLGESSQSLFTGLSAAYLSDKLTLLALARMSNVLLIQFYTDKPKDHSHVPHFRRCSSEAQRLLEEMVLCSTHGQIVAFDIAPIALLLHLHHQLHLNNGIDVQSSFPVKDRLPITSIKFAAGDVEIFADNIHAAFRDMEHCPERTGSVALRAWVSQYIPQLPTMEERFAKAKKVNTTAFTEDQLELLAGLARDALLSFIGKPAQMKHDTTTNWNEKKSEVSVKSNRYQNRLTRQSPNQQLKVELDSPNGKFTLKGKAGKILGKSGSLTTNGDLSSKTITSLTTIGREGPTMAEAQRAATLLRILQGEPGSLINNPWVQNIWFSTSFQWPAPWALIVPANPISLEVDPERPLNDSQQVAVQHMLSMDDKDRIVLIQGPPGTGKTSVISCFVEKAISSGYRGIWLIAQSNVAVKNIAEKLASHNFMDWRLLVSMEFQFDWHEHLYRQICTNVIRSDEFISRGFNATAVFKGCQVVLCTLSMLSSPSIKRCGITRCVPIKTLVVDEASQIEVGDYFSVFYSYDSIRKMCFIGDDKQLPPFGQEDNNELKSVFELQNLRKLALFLDTQYRMPPQLGDFISKAVYDDKLQSNPLHPIKNSMQACHFIDVADGKEEFYDMSYMNCAERQAVLKIARQLENDKRNYRIITPYDAQRTLLEEDMKTENLQWEDRCFNVDSFQGNEEDYIIISLVRSRALGFLKNLRRTNVMLTRCCKGMFICSSKAFLLNHGSKSLVGQLLKHNGENVWLDLKDLEKVQY